MYKRPFVNLCLLAWMAFAVAVGAQQSPPSQNSAPAKSPATQQKKAAPPAQSPPKPNSAQEPVAPADTAPDPDAELQMTVQQAGNDSAALIRNLEAYLVKYPDSQRRAVIYRALTESEMRVQNEKKALDYAEKVLALAPEDSQTLFLAATLLERAPDDASLNRAMGYDSHLIELVAKADPESRPQQMTLEDWQAGRNKFTMNLYVLRGKIERHLHKNDDAVKDLNESFRLLPNVDAALNLGEIAEEQKDADEAIRQYAVAFVLVGQDPDETTVSREALRLEMGNLWRRTHASNAGLGDVWLTSYDNARAVAKANRPDAPLYNKGLTDPFQFSLRRVDGGEVLKLAEARGKAVVLNFWTTWCSYCRVTESAVAEVCKKFDGRDDVIFLAVNNDEEEDRVGPFLQIQKIEGTLVFSDGLDSALKIETIPTILVLDRSGKIAYRTQGFAPDNLADALSSAITKASGGSAQ